MGQAERQGENSWAGKRKGHARLLLRNHGMVRFTGLTAIGRRVHPETRRPKTDTASRVPYQSGFAVPTDRRLGTRNVDVIQPSNPKMLSFVVGGVDDMMAETKACT